jgi:hypothetical protein
MDCDNENDKLASIELDDFISILDVTTFDALIGDRTKELDSRRQFDIDSFSDAEKPTTCVESLILSELEKHSVTITDFDRGNEKLSPIEFENLRSKLETNGHDKSIDALASIGSEPDTILEIGERSDPPMRFDLQFIPESQNRIELPKLEKAKFVEALIRWLKRGKSDTGNDWLRWTRSDNLNCEVDTRQLEIPIKSLFLTTSESDKTIESVTVFDGSRRLDSNFVAEFEKPAEELINAEATASFEK